MKILLKKSLKHRKHSKKIIKLKNNTNIIKSKKNAKRITTPKNKKTKKTKKTKKRKIMVIQKGGHNCQIGNYDCFALHLQAWLSIVSEKLKLEENRYMEREITYFKTAIDNDRYFKDIPTDLKILEFMRWIRFIDSAVKQTDSEVTILKEFIDSSPKRDVMKRIIIIMNFLETARAEAMMFLQFINQTDNKDLYNNLNLLLEHLNECFDFFKNYDREKILQPHLENYTNVVTVLHKIKKAITAKEVKEQIKGNAQKNYEKRCPNDICRELKVIKTKIEKYQKDLNQEQNEGSNTYTGFNNNNQTNNLFIEISQMLTALESNKLLSLSNKPELTETYVNLKQMRQLVNSSRGKPSDNPISVNAQLNNSSIYVNLANPPPETKPSNGIYVNQEAIIQARENVKGERRRQKMQAIANHYGNRGIIMESLGLKYISPKNQSTNNNTPPKLPVKESKLDIYIIDIDLFISNQTLNNICNLKETEQECIEFVEDHNMKLKKLETKRVELGKKFSDEFKLKIKTKSQTDGKGSTQANSNANTGFQEFKKLADRDDILQYLDNLNNTSKLKKLYELFFESFQNEKSERKNPTSMAKQFFSEFQTLYLNDEYNKLHGLLKRLKRENARVYLLSNSINIPLLKILLMNKEEFNKKICALLLRGDDTLNINEEGYVLSDTDSYSGYTFLDKYFFSEESLQGYKNSPKEMNEDTLHEDTLHEDTLNSLAENIWATLEQFKTYKIVDIKLRSASENTYSASLLKKLQAKPSDTDKSKYVFTDQSELVI